MSVESSLAKRSCKKETRGTRVGASTPGAIISPWVDFLCVGGVSIVVMIGMLIYIFFRHSAGQGEIYFGSFIILQALINWPHFMASYHLLYKPVENIKKYPAATLVVPLLLLFVLLAAVFLFNEAKVQVPNSREIYVQQDIGYFVWLVAAFYLAWHYTGQAWGMVASFAHLAGIKLTTEERLMLRTGLRVLLVWHVVWGMQDLPARWLGPLHSYIPAILNVVSACAIAAFIIGAITFTGVARRTGLRPTPQMLAPWVAIYLWYLVLFFEPNAYLLIQLSHALQYLIFPLRVELNRSTSPLISGPFIRKLLWSIRYYLLLVFAGIAIFYFPGLLLGQSSQIYTFALLISSMVSIHHYFVDSCIWKISNQDVRRGLFAHIKN